MKARLVEDYLKQHFQIYKNNNKSEYYNYIVLKGNELYSVRIEPGHPMQWKYETQIYKPTYNINGTLVKKPSKEMIYIFQNTLKPIRAVRDNLNVDEAQNFERGLDPKTAMSIGNYFILKDEFQKALEGIEIDGKKYAPIGPKARKHFWFERFKKIVKGKTIYAFTNENHSVRYTYKTIKVKDVVKSRFTLFTVNDEDGNAFDIDPFKKTYIKD